MSNIVLQNGYELKAAVEREDYKEITGLLIAYASTLVDLEINAFKILLDELEADEFGFGISSEGFEDISKMMIRSAVKQRLDKFFALCGEWGVEIDYTQPSLQR